MPSVPRVIDRLSGLSVTIIVAFCIAHVLLFLILWIWSRRSLRGLAALMDDFTRSLRHRSVLDRHARLSEQTEAFVADVQDILSDDSRDDDRQTLLERMRILDEKRRYLHSIAFETTYHICRSMIDAYPLAGVLGTILAIGAALQGANTETAATISDIVSRFGDAIWSTFAGLVSAISLMFINSLVETRFSRLVIIRHNVRDLVVHAKRELALKMNQRGEQ